MIAASPNTLEIRLLGVPEIILDGAPVALRTRKALVLLAYLAVEGKPQPRLRLMDMLWPDSDELLGRASLRNALAHIRLALGPYAARRLLAQEDSVAFEAGPGVVLDFKQLADAWRAARPGADSPPLAAQLERLGAAASAYRGEFLSGVNVATSLEFEAWLSLERERWRQQYIQVLASLSELQLESGGRQAAIATATRWLAEDPLSDAACRRLMLAQTLSGERHTALRTYQSFYAHLARELRCEPEAETRSLAEKIRRETQSAGPGAAAQPPAPPEAPGMPFVGRAQEYNQLVSAFYAALRSGARVVAIAGEAGIGKTRLVDEFLLWARTQETDILLGRAWEGSGRVPYQPLVEALRARLTKESELSQLVGWVWLGELARLLPEIRDRYSDLPQPAGDETTARQALYEAVARAGVALAQRRPVLLVLEDIHWSDSATLDILSYMLRSWNYQKLPVMLILTVRSEAMEDLPNFRQWFRALSRDVACLQVDLETLTAADIREFIDQLGSQGAAPQQSSQEVEQLSDWLWEETYGHPLLLTETVDAYQDQAVPLQRLHRWREWAAPEGAAEVGRVGQPETPSVGIEQVVQWRMSRLSQPALGLTRAAAVLGVKFTFSLLANVAETTEGAALQPLDELLRGRVLKLVEGQGLGEEISYAFAHEKIRDIVHRSIPKAHCMILHRRALLVLEKEGAAPAELAYHALEARQLEAAFRYTLAAGDAALEVFATQDAIQYYGQARRLLDERLGPTSLKAVLPVATIERLYVNLSRAYEIGTEWEQARTTYHTLFDIGRETRQTTLEWAALNRLAIFAAQHSFDIAEAMRLVEQALAVAESTGDQYLIAETEWNLTQMANFTWQTETAITHGRRAVELSRPLQQVELTARSLYALGDAFCFAGRWEECVAHLEEAAGLYAGLRQAPTSLPPLAAQYIWAGVPASHELQIQAMQASCLWQLAEAYVHVGRLQEGIATARESLSMGVAMNNVWTQAMSSLILGNALLEAGLYEEAYLISQDAVLKARRTPNPGLIMFTNSVFGAVCQALQKLDTAHKALLEALSMVPGLPTLSYRSFVISKICTNAVLRREWDEAYEYACQSIANRRGTPAALIVMDVARFYEIEALLVHGDREEAQREVQDFGAKVGENRRYRLAHLRCQAALQRGLGEHARAAECLQDAARLAGEIGLTGELWQILSELGGCLRRCARQDDAYQAFVEANRVIDWIAAQIKNPALKQDFLQSPPVEQIRQETAPC